MSALLSKTLSSLWKNIFAAVALACVVLLDKLLMVSTPAAQALDWPRILLGTLGVLLTVLIFQLAPKPPKEEPKKEEAKK